MIRLIKNLLLKYRPSFLQVSLLLWFSLPVLIFTPLYLVILLYYGILAMEESAVLVIAVFAVVLFISWEILYFLQCSQMRKAGKDRRHHSYTEVEGYLICSEPVVNHRYFNLPNKITGIRYHIQRASFHLCSFKPKSEAVSDPYFYYVQTKERTELFHDLFRTEEKYGKVDFRPQWIGFDQEIPVKLIYGKNSHVLKEFRPADHYPYTENQLKILRKWNEQGKNKNKSTEEICTDLPHASFVLFCESVLGSIVAFDLFFYLLCWIKNGNHLLNSLVNFVVVPASLFVAGFVLLLIYRFPANSEECLDMLRSWTSKKTRSEEVVLLSADTFRVAHYGSACADYLFPGETPALQKLYFRPLHSEGDTEFGSEYHINWVCTKSKIKALKKLYDCKEIKRYSPTSTERPISTEPHHDEYPYHPWTLRMDEPAVRKGLLFRNGVPLKITYVRSGMELKSMAPVEGYDYTEEQLAAIKKFNTLYP